MGPKLAQRIVLELKDRVKKMGFTGGTLELTGTDDAGIVSASQNAEQAVQALYAGAFALVVGGAITRPAEITARFTGAINAMHK